MDLAFHAPYIFRGALLVLVAGLTLAIWLAACKRRHQQIPWLVLLFLGLALLSFSGIALTETVPNAHVADMALRGAVMLIVAGVSATWLAALGLRAGRKRQAIGNDGSSL